VKVVIAGGSGHLGRLLARAHVAAGDDVAVLSRTPSAAPWRVVAWDAVSRGEWTRELEGADVVVNLAGRSVNCRYTAENRREIMASRVDSTLAVGRAIARAERPPRVWLQASTATIYAHRYDAPNDEQTGRIGGSEPDAPASWRFSIDVAQAWERAADAVALPQTRVVKLRSAIVLTPDPGGALATLEQLVRRGAGGPAGSGRQFVSWVHPADFVRALRWIAADETLSGPVNIAAPDALPNAEFMRELRAACGVPLGVPAPAWLLPFAARIMGTETELILKSRRVASGRLLASGFRFDFPTWKEAARDLCTRPR
jgi:uncharacterized protein